MAAGKVARNYNSKHLTKGDALPPFNGKLRLYNMRYCPYAQRTMLALSAKNLDFEIVNVDLYDKPEWLPSISTFGKVPSLQISKDVAIFESLVTVEYLDDVYPQRRLLPKDPLLKAKDKIIIEAFGGVYTLWFKLLRAPETITEEDIAGYHKTINLIQSELKQRGTKFLDGDQPGFVDYMIWPWFERLLIFNSDASRLDEKNFKVAITYIENLSKDPVIVDYKLPAEALLDFKRAYQQKSKPNYDYLLGQ